MPTIRELQDLYGQQGKQFTYYTEPDEQGVGYLRIPGTTNLGEKTLRADQSTLNLLDQSRLIQGGAARGFNPGGISYQNVSDLAGAISGGQYSPGSYGGPANLLDTLYSQTKQGDLGKIEEERVKQANIAGGFYVGSPQVGNAQTNAQLEQQGTQARNALLPQGVQPGQAFGQPAEQAQGIDPKTGQPIQSQTNAVQFDPTTGQPIDATLGANPQQVGGRLGTMQFGRVGNDVYEIMSDGSRRKVTEAEFNQKLRAQGLNLDVIPQLDLNDNISDVPGGTDSGTNPDGSPMGPSDFTSDYKNVIKELGLADIKGEFERVKKEYVDLQDKKNSEIIDVNNNPWLTEAIRSKEVDKINKRYELKENTLSGQQKLYESMYEEGIEQAKFITGGLQEDRNKSLDRALKREEAMADLLKANPSNFKEVRGGLFDIANGKWIVGPKEDGAAGALTNAQLNATINQIVGGFDNEPITKEYNTISAQLQALKTAGDSPTDDIQRIYAFAKVMDPNSVVREGEYNTVQQYSQALLTQYGLKAKRVFDNSGFLTQEARNFLYNTLQNRFNATETQYNNLRNSYQRRIDSIKAGGFNSLTDYGGAFPQDTQNTTSGVTSSGIKFTIIP